MLVFEGKESRATKRKTSQSKDENQQQTQPTYDAESGNRTRVTLVGGECSLYCAIPGPPSPIIIQTLYTLCYVLIFFRIRLCVLNVYDPIKGHTLIISCIRCLVVGVRQLLISLVKRCRSISTSRATCSRQLNCVSC